MKASPRKKRTLRVNSSNQLQIRNKWGKIGLGVFIASVFFFSIQETLSITGSSYSVSDDQDQDNIPNWDDFDDDNDGIQDQDECTTSLSEVFSFTGADQIANIPARADTIKAKIWGAGGRGDQRNGRGTGGSGGYTEIAIPVSALPGSTTQLIVTVGEGGNSSTGSSTYGNGGAGFIIPSGAHTGRNCGSGGGMSALSLVSLSVPTSVTTNDIIAIAGGGGTMPAYSTPGTHAGEGGGSNGGDEKDHPTQGGGGGSQISGGVAIHNGNPGSFLQGGAAVQNGGGGGGGFYGGASGNFSNACGTCTAGNEHGGGGGSGYVNPVATNISLSTGNLQNPPNMSDNQYEAGVGLGGNTNSGPGGNGLVVITYIFPLDCDLDGDGLANHLDLDSDGDGITDIIEAGGTDPDGDGQVIYPTPGDPMSMVDSDGDGLIDILDNINSGSGISEFTAGSPWPLPNTDGTGNANFLDIDSDDDGIVDYTEAQGTSTFISLTNVDTDGDGLDDAYDIDCQPCGGVTGINIVPWDSGNDPQADYMDTDSDGDGILDAIEGHDTNGDGVVDGNDTPSANTGIPGGLIDVDGDGLLDGYDNDTDPANYDATNGSISASFHPNTNGSGSERDWREQFVLPVEWLGFEVNQVGSDAQLSWLTASELNSDYFLVERSLDGLQFEDLAKVNAAGNSSHQSAYQFTDQDISFLGTASLLYRLKQVDINGSFEYSKMVELKLQDSDQQLSVVAYPNPVEDILHIRLNYQEAARLMIVNNAGQVIYNTKLDPSQNVQELDLAVTDWPAGVYRAILDDTKARAYQQIVKN